MGQGVSQFGCVPYQCNDRGEHHYAEAESEYLSAGGGAWSTPCGEVQKHASQPWMIGGGGGGGGGGGCFLFNRI